MLREWLLFSFLGGPLQVLGHGNMMWPPTWFDPNGTIGLTPGGFMHGDYETAPNMWFTNWTFIPGKPTLDPSLYSMPDFHGSAYEVWDKVHCFTSSGYGDVCPTWYPTYPDRNPWMAPGTAPLFSPCGIAGGNPLGIQGCDYKTTSDGKVVPGTEFCTWGGYSFGPDARDLEWPDAVFTEWERGGTAEVGWAIKANHGGGYSYRLCKVGEDGPGAVTEECFQRTPLKFASEDSWVQYGTDVDSNVVFKANRTTEGTFPPGSEWTMIPIPVCNSTDMGWLNPDCPNGFEFPPRGTGLHGLGEVVWAPGAVFFQWTLMDQVVVPKDLEPGDYVLSFRWDNEATPQVWNACSNVRLI